MNLLLALIPIIAVVLAGEAQKSYEDVLKNVYKKLDVNNDGTVTRREFLSVFKKLDTDKNVGITEKEFEEFTVAEHLNDELWREFNDNGDSEISYAELAQDFEEFDIDDNNKLTEAEFIEAIVLGMIFHDIDRIQKDGKVSQKEYVSFFDEADKSGDGKVDAKEFSSYWRFTPYPKTVIDKLYAEIDDDGKDGISKTEIENNFHAANADNDDALTDEEFQFAISTGPIGQIFQKLDIVDDERLSADEIFDALEIDGDDNIKKTEAKLVLRGIPDGEFEAFFEAIDKLGKDDDVLTIDEIKEFVKKVDGTKNEAGEKIKDGELSWNEFKNYKEAKAE